jgi:integrase
MGIVNQSIDVYYTYRFLRLLTTEWKDTDAFKLGIIQENPSKRVELPKKVKFKSSFYSKEETINLLAAFKDTTIETPVALAVSLGLRRGEVLGLRWSDVDLEKRQINICNTRVKVTSEIVDVTKTDSSTRILDLPDFLISLRFRFLHFT